MFGPACAFSQRTYEEWQTKKPVKLCKAFLKHKHYASRQRELIIMEKAEDAAIFLLTNTDRQRSFECEIETETEQESEFD